MDLPRAGALLLFAAAAALLVVAALTPLRAGQIAELDAEALRLGQEWQEASGEERTSLLKESNEAYAAARALEPPLAPLTAIGGALLLAAAGMALWPSADGAHEDAEEPANP